MVLLWRAEPQSIAGQWEGESEPSEAPGGREDAPAAKPPGPHCPQLRGKPTREGFQPAGLDGEAPLLIRGAIYTGLFQNCTRITLLLPGPGMLHVGAVVCFPGLLT